VLPPRLYERVLHPVLIRVVDDKPRRGLEQMRVFFPYFSMRVRYDDHDARTRLEPAGIGAPPIERYYDRLLAYALRARWGKESVGRADAQRAVERQAEPVGAGRS
jgi:hypothetical protein